MAERQDPFYPQWKIRSPSGTPLTVEFDRLRRLWRVTPGEYVRRQLADALAQATGSRRDAAWIVEVEAEITGRLGDHEPSDGSAAS